MASRTPYLAHLALFWRHVDSEDGAEMEVRLVVATEGERGAGDTNLEEKESFVKLHNSDKLQILDKSERREIMLPPRKQNQSSRYPRRF